MRLVNTQPRSIALDVGDGIVIGPHGSHEGPSELAQDKRVQQAQRKGLVRLLYMRPKEE